MMAYPLKIGLCLIGGLVFFFVYRSIPLQPLVALVDVGILITGLGLLNIIKPWGVFLLHSRWTALAILGMGLLLVIIGMLWPATQRSGPGSKKRIDYYLPHYSFFESHQIFIKASPRQVMASVEQVSLGDIPLARLLLRFRSAFDGGQSLSDLANQPLMGMLTDTGSGFMLLEKDGDHEIVGAGVGQPWRSEPPPHAHTPDQFMSYSTPGHVRVVFNMRTDHAGGLLTRLSSETRIQGNDRQANRIFACYWRLIYPGSAIIRRVWLAAIKKRAEENMYTL